MKQILLLLFLVLVPVTGCVATVGNPYYRYPSYTRYYSPPVYYNYYQFKKFHHRRHY